MNARQLRLSVAGAMAALMPPGVADGAFTGISIFGDYHTIAPGDVFAGGFAGSTLSVVRVQALFNNSGDVLTAVYGDSNHPMTLQTNSPSGFFNNTLGSNSAPDPALFGTSPSLAWDTYLTIGVEPGAFPDATQYSAGFPPIFNGTVNNPNIAWFTSVPLPQGTAGPDLQVFIMQLSFAGGLGSGTGVSGSINLRYRPAGSTSDVFVDSVPIFWQSAPPAPGTLAVFGLAGFLGKRRRCDAANPCAAHRLCR